MIAKICDYLDANAAPYCKKKAIDIDAFKNYVAGMRTLKTWGTEIEIIAAASLLKSSIYVFTDHGKKKWVEYKPCKPNGVLLDKSQCSPKGVFMVASSNHFQPVLRVGKMYAFFE